MAQKKTVVTTVTFTDDLDGKELAEAEASTVRFGWDGSQYEIDLGKSNADKLEKFLKPYVESARRVSSTRGRPKGSGSSTSSRAPSGSGLGPEALAAARDWLRKNGHEVSDRGRIKADLLALYDEAHAPATK